MFDENLVSHMNLLMDPPPEAVVDRAPILRESPFVDLRRSRDVTWFNLGCESP